MADTVEPRPWLALHPPGYPAHLDAPEMTALDMFECSVRRHPEKPAMHYFDRTLSYGEIDRAANSLAAALVKMGIRKGDRIIVQLQNIPQFLFAVIGSWKAGATVVPLNPMYRERELSFYCRDSGARAFVTMESSGGEARRAIAGTDVQHLITTSELDYVDTSRELPSVLGDSVKIHVEGALDLADILQRR